MEINKKSELYDENGNLNSKTVEEINKKLKSIFKDDAVEIINLGLFGAQVVKDDMAIVSARYADVIKLIWQLEEIKEALFEEEF